MIIYDFEVFKYNWLICWLDTVTKKHYKIWDSKELLEKFYNHYKNTIMIGYNSRNYDQYILKGILAGFNPYEISKWIVVDDRRGYEFSKLLNNFRILNYDCMVFGRSLKELEAFMGHDIQETPIPFDIDRPLTTEEKKLVEGYCFHDVDETADVFLETKDTFETIVRLIEEFNLPQYMISKTETQLAAEILGAEYVRRDDEFDIKMPDTLELGKYQWILDEHFYPWAKNSKNYEEIKLNASVMGVSHDFGVGGLHGAKKKYMGTGLFLMADVDSYYPASMIIYQFLSRNVQNPSKYRKIRDARLVLKRDKNPRQACYKLVLNKTFGGAKDKYNKLYDPRQANNLCIANQLFLVDLLDKLEGHCELIQSNTDGILVKLYNYTDEEKIMSIIHAWEERTGFTMGIDKYCKVIQRDVNNYILVKEDGSLKRKGSVVKKLSRLDNDLPIVNKAVVNYFVYGISPEETISKATQLIDFQKITKVSGNKYDFVVHGIPTTKQVFVSDGWDGYKIDEIQFDGNLKILNEKVNRVFASVDSEDGGLYKKHKSKNTLDKVSSTPLYCFIDNGNIENKSIPEKLDKSWYVQTAWERINDFV